MSRLILTLAVAHCPAIAQAQDYSFRLRNQPAPQAYAQLRDASMFSLGGVGFAAMLTAEEKAFHVILSSETAIPQFQRLLKEANPEGQLYALYGLYLKDPQLFKPAAARLKLGDPPARSEKFSFVERRKIRFANGCIFYDADRNETLKGWQRESLTRPSERVAHNQARPCGLRHNHSNIDENDWHIYRTSSSEPSRVGL